MPPSPRRPRWLKIIRTGYQNEPDPSHVAIADGLYEKATGDKIEWRKFELLVAQRHRRAGLECSRHQATAGSSPPSRRSDARRAD